jgi:hypothetical protein
MQPSTPKPILYGERGAYVPEIKRLWKARRIDLIHFPYDCEDRAWHDKHKIPFARPSLVTINTGELRVTDRVLIQDTVGSELHISFARVMRKSLRDFDVRHFDSAYKSGAVAFVTANSRHFEPCANALHRLSGIRVVVPSKPDHLSTLAALIASWPSLGSRRMPFQFCDTLAREEREGAAVGLSICRLR